jgi:N-acetylneuraminic acid mutarotase
MHVVVYGKCVEVIPKGYTQVSLPSILHETLHGMYTYVLVHTPADMTDVLQSLMTQFEREMKTAIEKITNDMLCRVRAYVNDMLKQIQQERVRGEAKVAGERIALQLEIAAMRCIQEASDTRVKLNVGGRRFQTSVSTLRSKPGNFFDALFSGRYDIAQLEDGSVFIDRDGDLFVHVLEYLRDGVVSVAVDGARSEVCLLRKLKREFEFFSIMLYTEGTPQEVAYAVGGFGTGLMPVASAERYDAVNDTWTTVASMSEARCFFGMCTIAGELYVSGGYSGDGEALASMERYNPSTDTWSSLPPMPESRAKHCVCAVNQYMYVLGGQNADKEASTRVLEYNSLSEVWSVKASMPAIRHGPAACVFNGHIFVIGGDSDWRRRSNFQYQPALDTWYDLSKTPLTLSYHSVCVLDNRIYVMGGSGSQSPRLVTRRPGEGRFSTSVDTVYCFDPVQDLYTIVDETMMTARSRFGSFVLGGNIYVAGGCTPWVTDDVEKYDPRANSWSPMCRMSVERECFQTSVVWVQQEVGLFDSLIATITPSSN